jgi:predicted DNA-binding transcriptional regulator YafY
MTWAAATQQQEKNMGYSDGRKQVRRILSIIERLQKARSIRVRDLADFYDVDITRIYDDLKIIEDFYDLKRDRGDYWIESERLMRWPRIRAEESRVLELVIAASPLAKEPRFEKVLKRVLEKLDTSLAEHIQLRLEQNTPVQLHKADTDDEIGEHLYLSEEAPPYSANPNDVEQHFRVLEEALYEQKTVRASYQPGGKPGPVVHLLHLQLMSEMPEECVEVENRGLSSICSIFN